MIATNAATVFVLGIRHGADPDHLAAIDGVTRNSYARAPLFSRFVGTLFAGGHTIMVLAISALVGLLGTHLAAHAAAIEKIGAWVSIAVLVAIAVMNVAQLRAGSYVGGMGCRARCARARAPGWRCRSACCSASASRPRARSRPTWWRSAPTSGSRAR
jgi:hypothetical protein